MQWVVVNDHSVGDGDGPAGYAGPQVTAGSPCQWTSIK